MRDRRHERRLDAGVAEPRAAIRVRPRSAITIAMASFLGLVAFLFLLGTISLYGAELNPVLARKLWPRGLQASHPTEVDEQVAQDATPRSGP